MATKHQYAEISESQVPESVRFDVPGRNQGQIVEVAYGGFSRAEHDYGDPYKRVIDRSIGPAPRYYQLVTAARAAEPAAKPGDLNDPRNWPIR